MGLTYKIVFAGVREGLNILNTILFFNTLNYPNCANVVFTPSMLSLPLASLYGKILHSGFPEESNPIPAS